MVAQRRVVVAAGLLLAASLFLSQSAYAQKSKRTKASAKPVLWSHPGHIPSRNLFYGPSSAGLAPVAPFKFIKESKKGESPKFDVMDARGVVWIVKLGEEAQAETVATRLVWSVGYFAEEAYYFDEVRIEGLPRLKRGDEYVTENGSVTGARFEPERQNLKEGPNWDWEDNPFSGTRQLSGVKVLMILLNNYDARKANNKIFYTLASESGGRLAHYYVTDLGATLGRAGGLGGKRSKNNLEDFLSTRFVLGVEDGAVEFDYDTRPTKLGHLSILYPPYYFGEVKKENAMRGIPVAHARWIGSLLSQVTNEQLHDAFRVANYDDEIREGYVRALRERINQLTQLSQSPRD